MTENEITYSAGIDERVVNKLFLFRGMFPFVIRNDDWKLGTKAMFGPKKGKYFDKKVKIIISLHLFYNTVCYMGLFIKRKSIFISVINVLVYPFDVFLFYLRNKSSLLSL